ncbi:MAG: cytochrome o ubiquinol oxidase subunit III [Oligoflexia bacterium]|nr:cytochrome o ubiquinol oxidase subunit III [Oligoflexia bacterium]
MSTTAITHDHHEIDEKTTFGFWIYIMTDCLLFATIFAVYAVLRPSTFGGPGPAELFSLPYVLVETFLLLISSFTFGMAMLAQREERKNLVLLFMGLTFLLGAGFIVLEIKEFHHLIVSGHSFKENAFLSGFFGLVGTHGLHVFCGLIWMVLLMIQIVTRGLTPLVVRKLSCLSLFWHFLDIIWIFVFTFVYLLGAI